MSILGRIREDRPGLLVRGPAKLADGDILSLRITTAWPVPLLGSELSEGES